MLTITVPEKEFYIEDTNIFVDSKRTVLQLEHSLISLHKWEKRYHVPYLETKMTYQQKIDYIRDMTITKNVDPIIYMALTNENLKAIDEYINDPMTATWFSNTKNTGDRQILTAEVIYYLMIQHRIPFECEKWHLNSLITLIRVCNEKSAPPKKMSQKEIYERNNRINEMRRKAMNSRG